MSTQCGWYKEIVSQGVFKIFLVGNMYLWSPNLDCGINYSINDDFTIPNSSTRLKLVFILFLMAFRTRRKSQQLRATKPKEIVLSLTKVKLTNSLTFQSYRTKYYLFFKSWYIKGFQWVMRTNDCSNRFRK